MKEEIKELLDDFKEILDNPTTTDECYDGRIIEIDRCYDLDLDEIKLLLDYITNLQEENERLKQYKEDNFLYDFEELQDKVINLQKENRELNRMCEIYSKSLYNADLTKAEKRIDKAIEYIHNHQPVFELSSKEQIQEWFEKEYYVDLLNILQGEDTKESEVK